MPKNDSYSYWLLLMQKPISIKSPLIVGTCSEKFLGVTIDSNFTFDKHINYKFAL